VVESLVGKTRSSVKDVSLRWSAQPKALVVDDDHCLVQVVHHMLQTLGFKGETANGGLAAMKCLSRSRYDLMVTDLQMPGMDGYALSGWLKHRPKGRDTKVIVMTGLSYANVVNYMNTGIVDRWIFKPFSLTKLADVVCELVPTIPGQHFFDRTGVRETGRPNGPSPLNKTDDSKPIIHEETRQDR
jgi:two-component system capsular synthesis sensor histidine kinase RcsC